MFVEVVAYGVAHATLIGVIWFGAVVAYRTSAQEGGGIGSLIFKLIGALFASLVIGYGCLHSYSPETHGASFFFSIPHNLTVGLKQREQEQNYELYATTILFVIGSVSVWLGHKHASER